MKDPISFAMTVVHRLLERMDAKGLPCLHNFRVWGSGFVGGLRVYGVQGLGFTVLRVYEVQGL